VDPVPDPLLLRKSGSAGDRTRDLCICSQKLWPLDHRGGRGFGENDYKIPMRNVTGIQYTLNSIKHWKRKVGFKSKVNLVHATKGYLNSGIKALLIFNLGNIWRCVDRKRNQTTAFCDVLLSALKSFGENLWLSLHSSRSKCGVSDCCKTCDLFHKPHASHLKRQAFRHSPPWEIPIPH